jgi:hypothetical protein
MLFKDILSALCVFFLNSEYKMSSVTRFIRQIPVNSQLHSNVNLGLTAASVAPLVFEFVAGSGNVVGNYPPGYMVSAVSGSALNTAITQALNANPNCLIRDMGKTVKCAAGSGTPAVPVAPAASAPVRYFRQVQLISPSDLSSNVGGVSGNTFGVLGGPSVPSASTSFLVFYIAVAAGEIIGSGPYAVPMLCGQL